jgi:hypothetical protein
LIAEATVDCYNEDEAITGFLTMRGRRPVGGTASPRVTWRWLGALGLNPKKLGSLDNHRQEPWKAPLAQFIEELHAERFGQR